MSINIDNSKIFPERRRKPKGNQKRKPMHQL